MSLLLVFCLASFLAVLASPSGLNLTLGPHNRDKKERWWPAPPGRSLAVQSPLARGLRSLAVQHDGRGLTDAKKGPASCSRSLLQLVEPAELDTITAWNTCVDQKVDTVARQTAGGVFGVYLDCWCSLKVEDVLKEFGCCEHPDFHLLCEAQCPSERSCDSAEAKQCIENCPALCLESDYQPEFCGTGCTSDCFKHMGCVVEHSKTMTVAGHPDHDYICDVQMFDNSQNWKDWQACYYDHPKRTHWHRHNAENNCYCESDLKAAAQKAKCCDAKWGKTICDEQCWTADLAIDCESGPAKACAEECNTVCSKLYEETMVPECKSTCFDVGSKCAQYSVCKPHGPWKFDYVCDDNSKPFDNGCCSVGKDQLGCPTLCDSWAPHLPKHTVAGIELRHGWECQCTGCPSTATAAETKWKETLTNSLWEHGTAQLALIAKRAGILGPNRRMQELMDERNKAILAAYEAHPGVPDDSFDAKVNVIVEDYHKLIEAEAQRFKDSGEKPKSALPSSTSSGSADKSAANVGLPQAAQEKDAQPTAPEASSESNTGLIVAAIAGVVGLFLIFGILVIVYKVSSKNGGAKGGANANPEAGASPYDGDSNVVMGRPIEAGAEAAAAQGAPVQTGGKGSTPDENAKDNNAKV